MLVENRAPILAVSLGSILATLALTGSIKLHWTHPPESSIIVEPLPDLADQPKSEETAVGEDIQARAAALINDLIEGAEILTMQPFPAGGVEAQVRTGLHEGRVVVMPDGEHLVIGNWYSRQGPLQAPTAILPAQPSTPAPAAQAPGSIDAGRQDGPDMGGLPDFNWELKNSSSDPRHWALNYPADIANIHSEEDLLQMVQDYPAIHQGSGQNIVYIFYDALCHACQSEYELVNNNISALTEQGIQVRWLPIVRFIGEPYEKAAFHLAAMASDAAINDAASAPDLLDKLLSPGTLVDDLLASYALTKQGKLNVQMSTRTFFRVIEAMPETAPGRGTPLSVFRNDKGEAVIVGGKMDLEDFKLIGPLEN